MQPHADQWLTPPADLTLWDNELHVWRIGLERSAASIQWLAATLSPDERARAERFHFDRDRRRFIAGRGALRHILSAYLRIPPEQLQFVYGAHGKPALAEASGRGELRFNVSHSHGLALCALASDQEIGVDLEYMRPLDDLEQIAGRFFSAVENDQLLALSSERRLEGFYNCWTRKEAYIKARGDGLAHPLQRFDVSLVPGEPARLLSIDGRSSEGARWFVQALAPAPGYVAALVVESRGWRVRCWQWPED